MPNIIEVNVGTSIVEAKVENISTIEVNVAQRGPAGADSTVPGPKGDVGPGVAPGGTQGQILEKSSDNDYVTQWVDKDHIPTNVSELTNDAGYATETYVDNAIAAIVDDDDEYLTAGSLSVITNSPGTNALSYNNGVFTFTPVSLSGYATETYVGTQITNLINDAPGILDTLGEIATALQGDETTIGGILTTLNDKIGLTNLSISTASANGNGNLSYNNTNGVFTFTPPDLSSYLTSITSSQVTTALGYTPYNVTNPSGYTTNIGTVTSVGGTGTVSGLTLSGTVTGSGNLTLGGTLSLTSDNVTTALGFTPYNATNPNNYITTGALSVTTNSASGSGSLSYSGGVFTFTPPSLDSYLTAESDTLNSVTTRGNTTTNGITVASVTFGGDSTTQTTAFPSYLLNTDEHILYVSEIGNDTNNGLRPTTAFATVKKALEVATTNANNKTVILIQAGVYTEIFPLTIPPNTVVKGAGLKAVTIQPTSGTRSNDCFYMDDNTAVSDLTVVGQLYNSGANTGYAFRFSPAGINITSRSPYVERVTVVQRGSVTSTSDPYGFNQGDAGRGVFLDGRRVNRGSIEPAMLFNECTFFTPNSRTLVMTNGARCEWLNCFSYFADLHYEAYFGTTGYGGAGKTYVTLVGKTGTWSVGNTLSLYANNGVTVLGSGVIESVSGNYLTLTGNVTGLLTNSARTAVTINVVGAAQLSTAQFKFSPSSLILNGTTDYISIASTPNYAYGNNNFTIEGWFYPTAIGGGTKTLVDQRTTATDVAVSLEMNNGGNVRVYINGAARITSDSPLVVNTWVHIAYSRSGGTGRLFINGVLQTTTYVDGNNYGNKPLVIGAAFNNLQYFPGYVDEFRISTNISRYSATFTLATQPFTGDSNTATLLHFTGANASQSIIDDGTVVQDVRSSGGGTATGISRYDRAEFGALLRANSGAMVYGNAGARATGDVSTSREDVVLQLMSYNIAYIGTGADLTNNRSAVVAANECVEVTGGRIIYVSVDQSGKFKVGNLFQVDFDTGAVTFSGPTYNVTSLSGITFTSGASISYIDGSYISTGNLVLAGNTISTTTGNITLDPAGSGTLALNGDTTVTGALTVTSGVTFGANGTQTQAVNYLNDLLDVTIAGTPTNGYVLKYNSSTGQWGPAPDLTGGGGGGGGVDLSQIYVTTTTASSGGTLSYDGAGQFTFAPADLSSYATTASLSGYATQTWVTNQGYLTGITSGQVTGALGYTPLQYTSLSVSTNTASGAGSLSYNNTNGVFTFTPPSLSSYLTASSLSVTTTSASSGGSLSYTSGVFTFAPADLSGYQTALVSGTSIKTVNSTSLLGSGNVSVGTVTSVAGTGTVNGITLTGTVTSSGSLTLGGTLGGIANNQLTNSTISGVSLGSNLNALTISSPLSGTSYNGSTAVTIALSSGYGDTQNPYASKTANYFLAAPNGTAGVPTFRAIVAADIPTLNQNTTGSAGSVANALTIGTGLSGTVSTYNGSAAVTISNAGVTAITTSSGLSTNTNATGSVSITNTGVTSLTAGTAISVSASTGGITVTNTGVTSAVAGTGISVSASSGAVTFTNTGVTSVTAGSNISVSASTGGVTISASGTPTFTSITTSDITITGQIIESVNSYTNNIAAAATVTLDCTTGNLWRIFTGTVSGNWTAALTNVTIANAQATNVTLIISQGTTPYIPTGLSVNGTSVTISWQGGITPTGNASKTDAVAFSIMQTSATPTFIVLGQLVTFG